MFNFSDQIFEAIIVDIDYDRGVCSLSPIDASNDSMIQEVPLPHIAGNGIAGIYYGFSIGTRVIAMFTSAKTRDITVIAGLIPKINLYPNNFTTSKPEDLPTGTYPYPRIERNDVIIRGGAGSELSALGSGNIDVKLANGSGIYLRKNQTIGSISSIFEDSAQFTNGGKLISGTVKRLNGQISNLLAKPDLSEIPLFADPEYNIKAKSIGFFPESPAFKRSYISKKRNPEISEYRLVINEFSTDSIFTGFDDEVLRYSNDIKLFENHESYARNRQQGNTLHLAEHELIEIIGGNVVSINGEILDINYNALSYGDNNQTPKTSIEESYDAAKRISRRGIGYHFNLTTNSSSIESSESLKNFIFDIDKEGLIKINIPASSNTGNIPYISNSNFNDDNEITNSYENPSSTQPIPVTLRDKNGSIVYPDKNFGGGFRKTGIRFSNGEQSPYFPGNNNEDFTEIRINTTKYHDITTIAERLIANTIRYINIPQKFLSDDGFPEGLPVLEPFEIAIPNSLKTDEGDNLSALREVLAAGKTDFPTYMSVVAVEPGAPAIYSGGETLIAGRVYNDDLIYPAYSNSFTSVKNNESVEAIIGSLEESFIPVGGKSAAINFEGSLEMSVGKDNYDQKSIVLDTAGSLLAWLGKDRNNRSGIIQTDGDLLLNVGGSYTGTGLNQKMNKGRFDLRINITDKGFVTTTYEGQDNSPNVGAESDILISLSEDGIVIAGMKTGMPMVFRNSGPILIESTSSDITLKGLQIKTVDAKGAMNQVAPPSRN